MAGNGRKWQEMAGISGNGLTWLDMDEIAGMAGNGLKQLEKA